MFDSHDVEMETFEYKKIIQESSRAWLLKFEDCEAWLPKSQCSIDTDTKRIEIPLWLCEEKQIY